MTQNGQAETAVKWEQLFDFVLPGAAKRSAGIRASADLQGMKLASSAYGKAENSFRQLHRWVTYASESTFQRSSS